MDANPLTVTILTIDSDFFSLRSFLSYVFFFFFFLSLRFVLFFFFFLLSHARPRHATHTNAKTERVAGPSSCVWNRHVASVRRPPPPRVYGKRIIVRYCKHSGTVRTPRFVMILWWLKMILYTRPYNNVGGLLIRSRGRTGGDDGVEINAESPSISILRGIIGFFINHLRPNCYFKRPFSKIIQKKKENNSDFSWYGKLTLNVIGNVLLFMSSIF